jgi:hypothetical protein
MPYFLLFALMYIFLFLVVWTYAVLLSGRKYERRPPKQYSPPIQKKPPTIKQEANSFTWDARTGELLAEEYVD